jgi:pilus assembly protein CpaE
VDVPIPPSAEAELKAAAASALVFVQDRDSEGIIRQCLIDLGVVAAEFKNGGVDTAIAELAARSSPTLLIVDVQGVDDPVSRIQSLADVCDPNTGVVVIGDKNDIPFYRRLKAVGVVEYYYKPLVRIMVMQTCNGIITGNRDEPTKKTGKLVLVVCVRGGAGATTIVVSTAWHLAETLKRRVTVLDLDLQFGDAALQLGVSPTHALQDALDHPDRVDELFLDRGVIRVDERLGVFAALSALDDTTALSEPAVLSILERLLVRNRYVFVDIPMRIAPHMMHLLHLPSTVLLVSTGSLVCARDVGRLREKIGTNTAERVVVHILNKNGASESLSAEEFARAAGSPPDIVIPESREIALASRLGIQGLYKSAVLQHGLEPLYRQLSGETPSLGSKSWIRNLLGLV